MLLYYLLASHNVKWLTNYLKRNVFEVVKISNVYSEIKNFNYCFMDKIINEETAIVLKNQDLLFRLIKIIVKKNFDSIIHYAMNESMFYPSSSYIYAIIQFIVPGYITSLCLIYNISQQKPFYLFIDKIRAI